MSGTVAPAAPPTPGAMPGGQPQGQPPIGSSPATGPSQNLGMAAKGMEATGALLNAMGMLIPMVGAGTPLGQSIAKAIGDIGKHIQPGAATPQGSKNFAQQMMLQQAQMGPHRAAIASQAPGGAPGGGMPPGAGMPPGGAPPGGGP